MVDRLTMYQFSIGSDRITVGGTDVNDAQRIALALCTNYTNPLYYLGELEWTHEMREQVLENETIH